MNVGTHESVKVSKCYGEIRDIRERCDARAVKVIFNRFFPPANRLASS